MAAIALALGSAALWGTADFLGGLRARRIDALSIVCVSQPVGLAGVAVWVLVAGGDPPELWRLAVAFAGGAAGVIGLACFYRALAIGTMSIVAPVSATGATIPVVAGLASGEAPGALQLTGIALAVGGVILASQERHADGERAADARRAVGLALLAALGFGTLLTLLEPASREGVAWPLLAVRLGSVLTLATIVAATRASVRPALTRVHLPVLAVIGVLDTSANALYATATTHGLLSVVSVLGSLYPVTTVILARALLGERVRMIQEVGVVAVLCGIALIVAG